MELKPRVIDIPLYLDDRGSVYGALDNMNQLAIKRTYVVRNWKSGLIRAWHGHCKAETYLHVISGAAKICAKEMAHGSKPMVPRIFKATLSAEKPQLFYVPPGWYNGTMTLQEDTRILVYSTLTLDEVKKDDVRSPLLGHERVALWRVEDR